MRTWRSSRRTRKTTASLVPAALLLLALLGALWVGGDDGWAVPPTKDDGAAYNRWASKNRFLVGDSVHFKYKTDSVMVVTEDDYSDCRASHPIFFSNNGDTDVRLDRPGLFYFISGVAGHCERGQRMIVKVIGHDAPPPAAAPATAPPSPPQPSGAASLAGTGALAAAVAVAPIALAVVVHGV
ncbi:hypothetical protein ACP4OV_026049 [Aristida adscensionis]